MVAKWIERWQILSGFVVASAHTPIVFFSPPENSALLLETPENDSSKLHCGKIKLRPVLHRGKVACVGPGSRSKLEVQNTPSNGPHTCT